MDSIGAFVGSHFLRLFANLTYIGGESIFELGWKSVSVRHLCATDIQNMEYSSVDSAVIYLIDYEFISFE